MTSPPSLGPASPPGPHTPTAFRFKRKHPDDPSAYSPSNSKRRSRSPSFSHRTHRHRHHPQRRHRSHRRHYDRSPSPPQQTFDSEAAFRESLFDALADDEGAAFWESVYGQPIHTYSPYRPSRDNHDAEQTQTSLERMTDEEYASFVRARMWEKSHGYIIEERRRREEEQTRRKKRDEEERRWEKGVEEALRRGEERRRKDRWKDAWGRYERGWERSKLANDEEVGTQMTSERIPWPVETGRSAHVGRQEVETFFKHAPQLQGVDDEVNLGKTLKLERIRWHPDKFLQRAGSQGMSEESIATVTAVFQIVDMLWSETRQE
ncbi:MAG: hypothetical protein Q9216_000337 [Gyalolechia sp. 2 TL-2023]